VRITNIAAQYYKPLHKRMALPSFGATDSAIINPVILGNTKFTRKPLICNNLLD
jgi:hypothetical protein